MFIYHYTLKKEDTILLHTNLSLTSPQAYQFTNLQAATTIQAAKTPFKVDYMQMTRYPCNMWNNIYCMHIKGQEVRCISMFCALLQHKAEYNKKVAMVAPFQSIKTAESDEALQMYLVIWW